MEEMTATLNQQKKELKTVTDKYSYLKGQITEMKTEFFLKLGSLADELDGMKMHRAAALCSWITLRRAQGSIHGRYRSYH